MRCWHGSDAEAGKSSALLGGSHGITLVRQTTRALGGGCSFAFFLLILSIDGAVTDALNFAACVRWCRHL